MEATCLTGLEQKDVHGPAVWVSVAPDLPAVALQMWSDQAES